MIPAGNDRLARRFLHVCLNIRDFGASRGFYVDALGLRLAMQTDDRPIDGDVIRYAGKIRTRANFIYDWRGPRSSCALELVEWTDPPIEGQPYDDVTTPGLHAIAIGVPSLRRAETHVTDAGGVVLSRHGRSAFGEERSPAMLVRDPDGATVEIVEINLSATTVLGVRATCSNLGNSLRFYQAAGFGGVSAHLKGEFVWGEGKAAMLALPEDEGGFSLCLAESKQVSPDQGSYAIANHSGFTRMALRVDDAQDTCGRLSSQGLSVRGPFPVSLGGTAVEGLQIGTADDPDGILVEFVDRPKSFFRPPPAPPTGDERETVGSAER